MRRDVTFTTYEGGVAQVRKIHLLTGYRIIRRREHLRAISRRTTACARTKLSENFNGRCLTPQQHYSRSTGLVSTANCRHYQQPGEVVQSTTYTVGIGIGGAGLRAEPIGQYNVFNAGQAAQGDVAQLGERLLCTQEVASSILVVSTSSNPLTPVVSGLFRLTGQALTATAPASRDSSAALVTLSRIDPNMHGLPVVGTSTGTSGEGVKSSVPVALTTFAVVCGSAPSGGGLAGIPLRRPRRATVDRCRSSSSS